LLTSGCYIFISFLVVFTVLKNDKKNAEDRMICILIKNLRIKKQRVAGRMITEFLNKAWI